MILGLPRSGTNLLSALLKATDGPQVIVEPFSMAIPWVLRDDTFRREANVAALKCNCHDCYTCRLRAGISSQMIHFKETSLFEYLDIFHGHYGVSRIVWLSRDPVQVESSYVRHELGPLWDLDQRRLWHRSNLGEYCINESVRRYAQLANQRKLAWWALHRPLFSVHEVKFDELVERPLRTLAEVAEFTGRRISPRSLAAIEARRSGNGRRLGVYSTLRRAR